MRRASLPLVVVVVVLYKRAPTLNPRRLYLKGRKGEIFCVFLCHDSRVSVSLLCVSKLANLKNGTQWSGRRMDRGVYILSFNLNLDGWRPF